MASSTAPATYTMPQFSASAYGHTMQHYPAFGPNPLAGIAQTIYRPNFYTLNPSSFGPPQFAPHPTTSAADAPQSAAADVLQSAAADVPPTTSASAADVPQSAATGNLSPTDFAADAHAATTTERSTSASYTTCTTSATADISTSSSATK